MSVSPNPSSESLPSPQKPPQKPRKSKTWRKAAEERHSAPYNPLDLENLGRSVEAELLSRDPEPLDEVSPVYGSGIYALYYCGSNPLYAKISSPDCRTPVYVGQARPTGVRKGTAEEKPDSTTLWDRIYEHKQSLLQVHDLKVSDFRVRYLVAIEAFVSIAERVIIRHYRPVWNSIVDGFGNHDPGANRRKDSYRPAWDELHPGRWWSHPDYMPTPSKTPAAVSRSRIQDLLAGKMSEADVIAIEEEQTEEKMTEGKKND
ncbi:Eco29kI family restriction endonuclease [Streptomyces sp. NPDC096068]|uniref:Eco29kI family restriction endonuclease n=1 Tax=Streptomyces sp. NPDC096068 TaxID=3155424 RepID=UPI00331C1EBC